MTNLSPSTKEKNVYLFRKFAHTQKDNRLMHAMASKANKMVDKWMKTCNSSANETTEKKIMTKFMNIFYENVQMQSKTSDDEMRTVETDEREKENERT